MLFLNVDVLLKNCLTDCLLQMRIICSPDRLAIAINTAEVSAKLTCLCARTQENRKFFASTGQCIVYLNKICG